MIYNSFYKNHLEISTINMICRLNHMFYLTTLCLVVLLSRSIREADAQGMEVLPQKPKQIWNPKDQITTLLNKPYSPATYASMSSYIYQFYGEQSILDIESKQACRLNTQPCLNNSQCCSKFCRCVKWNTMGREVCWRRCL